ncbi:MAG: hypothetical protein ACLRUZ_10425 [Faecalimonas sp.]|jgi:hypothetical protein
MDEKKVREAIEDFKELSIQMRERGFSGASKHCDLAIEALEKQLPKKVEMLTEYRDLNGNLMCFKAFCPSCGRVVESYRNKNCHVCTQVLDWSE